MIGRKFEEPFCAQKGKFAIVGIVKDVIILIQDGCSNEEDAVDIAKQLLFGHITLPEDVSGKLDDFKVLCIVNDDGVVESYIKPTWSSEFTALTKKLSKSMNGEKIQLIAQIVRDAKD